MKNIFILVVISFITHNISAQIIVDLDDDSKKSFAPGYYYKDFNNYFDPYIGTWKYVNEQTEMTVTLKKIIKNDEGKYYSDILVGDMRYVKNGIVQFDNLSRITGGPQTNPKVHDLYGTYFLKPNHFPKCPECPANERRINMIFYGSDNNDQGGGIVLQRITTSGQPDTIKLTIKYLMEIDIEGEPAPLPPKIEGLEFVLTKQ